MIRSPYHLDKPRVQLHGYQFHCYHDGNHYLWRRGLRGKLFRVDSGMDSDALAYIEGTLVTKLIRFRKYDYFKAKAAAEEIMDTLRRLVHEYENPQP